MSWHSNIKSVWAALHPTCREAVRAESDRLEHPLPPAQRVGLWLHLLICVWCRRYGKQIHLLHDQTKEHADNLTRATSQNLSAEARDRIKRKMQEHK